MAYQLMGRIHAELHRLLTAERGQGTVEYVALILLVAAVLAGVIAATKGGRIGKTGIAQSIVNHIKSAMGSIK